MIDRETLRAWLVENGIDDLHSWRCSHADIYGACTCVDEFTDDLLAYVSN
jgi:hypothetical protein